MIDVIALVVALVALVLGALAIAQVAVVRKKLAGLPLDGDVLGLLRGLDRDLHELEDAFGDVEPRLAAVERALPRTINRTAVVVFDAFGDISGNQSRAIALLDTLGNGIVLSVLVGRGETLFFTKEVSGSRGTEQLSPEEQEAVDRAMRR